jgi:hypothetical protein
MRNQNTWKTRVFCFNDALMVKSSASAISDTKSEENAQRKHRNEMPFQCGSQNMIFGRLGCMSESARQKK